MTQARSRIVNPSNRLGLDYESEAARLGRPPSPIVDVHTHINGIEAARIYLRAADLYGVAMTWSMTALEQVEPIAEAFPGRFRFIAVPNYLGEDRRYHHGPGYAKRIERFHALGVRVAKFWGAPKIVDYGDEAGDPSLLRLDSPLRMEAMDAAAALGMTFMTHIADPDTWFATRYADASRYGTKREQYDMLEKLLERYPGPWIAAHMGGWPENLEFIAGLLERHPHLHLDTSAAKWQARELSRYDRDEIVAFLRRFQGRVLFGSDVLASDEHLRADDAGNEYFAKAASADEAFDLYASRYWVMRTLLETDAECESPIVDPDLAMVDPERHGPHDAPLLRGHRLPADLLRSIYHDATVDLLGP